MRFCDFRIANITRCFYWIPSRFEIALLVQSVLMICFQIFLLHVCIRYRSATSPTVPVAQHGNDPDAESDEDSRLVAQGTTNPQDALDGPAHLGSLGATAEQIPRAPSLRQRLLGKFWAWDEFGSYLEFMAVLIVGQVVGIIIFWGLFSFGWYTEVLGAFALGLESTVSMFACTLRYQDADSERQQLPIPQLITNFRRKSLAGFRMTVLLGWIFGDAYKVVYFFLQEGNTPQFKIWCARLFVSVDVDGVH